MLALPSPGPSRARLWLALWPAILLPVVGALIYFVWLPGTPLGRAVYAIDKVLLFAWPFIAMPWLLRQRFSRESPSKKAVAQSLIWGLVFALATVAVMWALLYRTAYFGGQVAAGIPMIRQRLSDMGVMEHYIAFGLFLSFVNSALEEFYWRWFVYGHLRLVTRPVVAHLGAAVAFTLHHYVVLDQFFPGGFGLFLSLCVGTGGLAWSLIYARFRSLWGSWLSHALVDIGFLALCYPLIFPQS